ncbi:hypothetical protein [Nonomuraea sp. NPDC049625]|uniref:hypothetical protein n=1 Tax=Nonomuraea sp. NPDC049625 TaxID=3155775 RepID=UPI00342912CF
MKLTTVTCRETAVRRIRTAGTDSSAPTLAAPRWEDTTVLRGDLAAATRLFPETGPDRALDLVESRGDSKGVTTQVYRPAGRPQYASV